MTYLSDDLYLFRSGDGADTESFHFWMRGGHDGWDESGWAEAGGRYGERDSGVAVPAKWVDRFVLMRLAQLCANGDAVRVLESMVGEMFGRPGNAGEGDLRCNLEQVRQALTKLQAECESGSSDVG